MSRQCSLAAIVFFFVLNITAAIMAAECENWQSRHPDWIFCEDFEGASFLSQWQEVSHPDRKIRETNAANVFEGSSSLRITFPPGDSDGGGWMHYWWDPDSSQDAIYMRWYVKYSSGFNWGDWDVKESGLRGLLPGDRYGPGAGVPSDGTYYAAHILSLGVSNGPSQPHEPILYYYHLNQLSRWGDFGYQNQNPPNVAFDTNRWHCLELMIDPNDVGQANGEIKMWIDSVPKGAISGITWRTNPDVQTKDLFMSAWIGRPLHSQNQYRWEDNYVLSNNRIGCLGTKPSPPINLDVINVSPD